MNTTQTFTAADVAALADLIRPHLERVQGEGMSFADSVEAAVLLAKAEAERDFVRRSTDRRFMEILMGTYDEFRAEAAA